MLILIQLLTIRYCPVLPFGIRIGLASLSTFYIGVLWKENTIYLSFSKKKSNLILLIFLPLSILLGYKFGRIDVYKMEFAGNLFQYYILIILNLLLWIEISKKISNIKFLKLMGENTIYILGLHYYILFFMRTTYKILGMTDFLKDKMGFYFIEGVLAIIISYLLIRVKDYLIQWYGYKK